MPRVFLVNPPPKERIEQFKLDFPHMGIGYLAASLLEKGIDVKVIDCRLKGFNQEQFRKYISGLGISDYDLVGITSMTHNVFDAHFVAGLIKDISSTTKTVLGGPHATALPRRTLEEFPCFDFLVMGEGEKTIVELAEAVVDREEKDLSEVKGLAYRDEKDIIVNERREWIYDLDELPFPAWELFDLSEMKRLGILGGRGCPFSCNFCMRFLGKKVRLRSPENVVAEIERDYQKFGVTQFNWHGDTDTINKKWFNKCLDLIEKRSLDDKISWDITTRVDTIDEDLLKRMKRCGCQSVGFGVESGDPEILRNTKKGITKEQVREAIKIAKRAGTKVGAFFILGHPNENLRTALRTIGFARELNPDHVSFGIMTPYPGTEIYDMAIRGKGDLRLISDTWIAFDKNQCSALETKDLSNRTLKLLQLLGFFVVYLGNLRFSTFASYLEKYWRLATKNISDIISGEAHAPVQSEIFGHT